ncbi:unnamed protein product [Cylicocyclus nassatus]|uniref:Uncharacterized protein n=1 Tax=Cylicocyclus nassatus TaxID=53992 RepID=A0AA36GGL5_CYLNA|nr:unnamed protein product [Cylicocyclus nassatus]
MVDCSWRKIVARSTRSRTSQVPKLVLGSSLNCSVDLHNDDLCVRIRKKCHKFGKERQNPRFITLRKQPCRHPERGLTTLRIFLRRILRWIFVEI